jgi:hypothetical protein
MITFFKWVCISNVDSVFALTTNLRIYKTLSDTVRVGGEDNDVCSNVRKGLDIANATNFNLKG